MRLDSDLLLRARGIPCFRLSLDVDGDEVGRDPVRLVHVTDGAIAAARRLGDPLAVGPGSLDLRYGDIVALSRREGETCREIFPASESRNHVLTIGGRDLPLGGPGMLETRNALEMGAPVSPEIRNAALPALNETFQHVAATLDMGVFPREMVAVSLFACMTRGMGPAHLDLPFEDFLLRAGADMLRARIEAIDPGHPDALHHSPDPLEAILVARGATLPDGEVLGWSGADIRKALLPRGGSFREVIEGITSMPPEELDIRVLNPEETDLLKRCLAPHRLGGEWVSALQDSLSEGDGEKMDSPEIRMHSVSGRDVLLFEDDLGRGRGAALLCSWPRTARRLLFRNGDHGVGTISPEEIPDHAEVARLSSTLAGLDGMMAHRNWGMRSTDVDRAEHVPSESRRA